MASLLAERYRQRSKSLGKIRRTCKLFSHVRRPRDTASDQPGRDELRIAARFPQDIRPSHMIFRPGHLEQKVG
jgi:hypothetical protein